MNQGQFDFTSKEITRKAIKRAEDHANAVHESWSDIADEFLKKFIRNNPAFQCEDVRYASIGIVPSPPSQRAWGACIRRAVINGLIRKAGYKSVKNINAHRALSAVWHRI